MNTLYQLTRPWAYWGVCGAGKRLFDWWLPVILAALTTVVVWKSNHQINFFGAGGVTSMLTGFIQNLPGFFIAALAAVATFDREELDSAMPSPTPSIGVYEKGRWIRISLTRRRFLTVMFAFLTVQSIVITLAGIGLISASGWVISFGFAEVIFRALSIAAVWAYSVLVWQLLTVTCLGLYYLGDRIHQPDV